MGVSVAEPANAPLAADSFPPVPDPAALANLSPGPYIELALARRWDRLAANKLRESGGVLAVAARTALRPRLDFAGRISANTITETTFGKMSDGWVAPGWQASLQFEAPVHNYAAKGRLMQAEADLAQRTINSTDLDRNIKANLVSLVASVKSSGLQVARLDESVRLYGETVESETERYKSGQSSLIDTILTQDLQTSSLVRGDGPPAVRHLRRAAPLRDRYARRVARGPQRREAGRDLVTLPATSR